MPNSVTPNMPLNTAVPSVRRISAPAPTATTSGTTPRMKANDVIMIGRSRSCTASSVARRGSAPSSRRDFANSTIRIAFLQARPTSTMKPICVKMLMSWRATQTPAMEQSRHIGTTRMTASGSDQLSYWAASTRNTRITARRNTYMAVLPVCNCNSASSVQSVDIDGGRSCSAVSCISDRAVPELTPGAAEPLIAAAAYML